MQTQHEADTIRALTALKGPTVAISDARSRIPRLGGLYAWWVVDAALPGVPANGHPSEKHVDLLYVGIAPNGESSTATLHSRVVGNHLNGNIAASTLRRTLASLLVQQLALSPVKRGTKVVLPDEQNTALSEWQRTHLRLTWHSMAKPWLLEGDVIQALKPPLNLDENEDHPFYKTLSAARRALRAAAR